MAGIDEHLRIEPDGAATIAYGEPQNTERTSSCRSRARPDQALLDAADLDAMPTKPEPTGCADCFVYTVEYGGHTVTYDDATEPRHRLRSSSRALGEVADEHQPAAPATSRAA